MPGTIVGMRVVLQRVTQAQVRVEGEPVATIGNGLCLLVGIGVGDGFDDVDAAVAKIANLRVFGDERGRLNLSALDVAGQVLVVSQFTLFADISRGRRPSFSGVAQPDHARDLIDRMIMGFKSMGLATCEGVFGAKMELALVNDGPVTINLEFQDGKPR